MAHANTSRILQTTRTWSIAARAQNRSARSMARLNQHRVGWKSRFYDSQLPKGQLSVLQSGNFDVAATALEESRHRLLKSQPKAAIVDDRRRLTVCWNTQRQEEAKFSKQVSPRFRGLGVMCRVYAWNFGICTGLQSFALAVPYAAACGDFRLF